MEQQTSREQQITTETSSNFQTAFRFSGSGVEFFKIWIVNLLLSIVTLGIYSAWAKVRTNRYFYGNTYLADTNFEYHAEPIQILKGRIIAVVFFLCYTFAGLIHPVLAIVFGVLLLVLIPWIIVNGLRFNARMSSYRGVHFNFHGGYGGVIINFFLLPIASAFTLFILLPFTLFQQAEFYLSNHSYGTSKFKFSAGAGKYYKAFFLCFLLMLVIYLVAYFLIGNTVDVAALFNPENIDQPPPPSVMITIMLLFYGPLLLVGLIYKGMAYNIAFDHLSIKSNQFNSRLKVFTWAWIVVSNMVLILCTLGIYYPWARVRAANYKANVTEVNLRELDSFVADEQQRQSALGEEVGEAFDIGIGI